MQPKQQTGAPRTYNIEFNASQLPSGVYIYSNSPANSNVRGKW